MRTNKERYQAAFSVLHASRDLKPEVNDMEGTNKIFFRSRFAMRLATVVCALVLCTGAVFAAVHFLSPAEVADEIGDASLAKAFRSKDAVRINETQSFDNYDVTLLGMVSGKDLSDGKVEANEGEFHTDRSYIAVAIERKDRKTIGEDDSFFVTPLIDGYSKHDLNIASLLGGYSSIYSDDMKTEYYILDMDNIEPFADHEIHLAAQAGSFTGGDDSFMGDGMAYDYDESTGKYSPKKDYDGVNAFFELPIDSSKADPDTVKDILKRME